MKKLPPILGFVMMLASASVQAAILSWSFSATIRDITTDAALAAELANLGISSGTDISGSFLVDDTTPDVGTSGFGVFQSAVVGAEFSIGALNLSYDSDAFDVLSSVLTSEGAGGDRLDASAPLTVDGFSVSSALALLSLVDSDGQFIDASQFPVLPDLAGLDTYAGTGGTYFEVGFLTGSTSAGAIRAELTSLNAAVVPVPAAAILFGSALLALPGVIRRRQRKLN